MCQVQVSSPEVSSPSPQVSSPSPRKRDSSRTRVQVLDSSTTSRTMWIIRLLTGQLQTAGFVSELVMIRDHMLELSGEVDFSRDELEQIVEVDCTYSFLHISCTSSIRNMNILQLAGSYYYEYLSCYDRLLAVNITSNYYYRSILCYQSSSSWALSIWSVRPCQERRHKSIDGVEAAIGCMWWRHDTVL